MSAVLAFFLLFSSFVLPVSAQQMQVISIKEEVVTPNSTSITAEISQLPSSGILRVVQLEQGEVYDSAKLNSYTSLYFSVVTGLAAGENQLELSSAPAAGKQMIAVLRDSSGDELVDYVSNAVNVTDGEQGGSEDTGGPGGVQDAETILAGCSVDLLKEGNFQMTDTSASVRVKLHSSIDKCYLTIFAYAGNTSFDADASQNIRLWSGFVADGYEAVCDFSQSALPLKKGYKVIACLNVPVGEDYYRSVTSRAVEVVDENGEGFTDYIYPDVSIDEQELQAGATSLHISLTGDPRIFQAAKEGKTSVTCAVAQYPAEDDFDFEFKDADEMNQEITLDEGTEDAVEDIAEETVAVSEDEE